jgi:predicted ATPase/class 3 adenylate cyclase
VGLPAGTITLLFTDIEGSTRMLGALGEDYAALLAEHHRLLRAVWAAHGGVEVDTEGDAFFVAFPRAGDAVAAAAEAQRALAANAWPGGARVRVRMGIHTGEPELSDGRYVGIAVHYAARLAAAAHGGQVLLSETSRALTDASVEDLGEHRLKDFPEPRPIFHLVVDGAGAERFPPPRTLDLVRTNLPAAAHLIGREQDLWTLVHLCKGAEDRSVLTLAGPGGTGKTQLALAAGHELLEHFTDGVFLVALEGIADPDAVPAAIARSLGLPDEAGVPAQRRVAEHVRDRRLLLVLDNFEHVLDAAPAVAALAAAAPATRLLVTSQAPLRVRDEQVIPLAPLELPRPEEADLAALEQVPSVALLVARARAADPSFALTAGNAAAIGELCTRLDGMPLALELAAARLALLDPAQLVARLGESLDALGEGRRDLPPRQRGLRATLDWTTGLLSAAQRELLARLGVFAGGFTVELAEAAADGDVLADLAALREVSLVRRDATGRLAMAPPVRIYALQALREQGLEQDARARHLRALLAFAEPLTWTWVERYGETMDRVEPEFENLRAALDWAATHDAEAHARLVAAIAWWFSYSGRSSEIEAHVERAQGFDAEPLLRAGVLTAAGMIDYESGRTPEMLAAAEAWGALGDSRELALVLFNLSNLRALLGEPQAALEIALEARDVARRVGEPLALALAEEGVAQGLWMLGRAGEALDVARRLLDAAPAGSFSEMGSATTLADAALAHGEPELALVGYVRALAALASRHPRNLAFQLDGIAMALAGLERDADALLAAAVGDLVRREFSTGLAKVTLAQREEALEPVRARAGPAGERAAADRAAGLGLQGGIAWAVGLEA